MDASQGASTSQVIVYTAVPIVTVIVGGVIAVLRRPSRQAESYIQHFAAGVVFSALAVEVLPDVLHRKEPLAATAGFALGVLVMLLVQRLGEGTKGKEGHEGNESPRGYLIVVGVDMLIDGLLLGIGFSAGQKAGRLLAIALAGEFLSLGLATAALVMKAGISRTRAVGICVLLGGLTLAGVLVGTIVLGDLSNAWMEGLLAFAAAALLYLVTEELLVEAHEVKETQAATTLFFIGFLFLMILEMVS